MMAARATLAATLAALASAAISQDPVNPHYYNLNGATTALIGSSEHYGAVFNLDFDYRAYFTELQANALSLTRTWSAMMYLEHPLQGSIFHNTLGPLPGRYLSPYALSDQGGYNSTPSLPLFDLSRWNESYFERLTDFVSTAAARGVVVEFGLFSNQYSLSQWSLSPLYPTNNINGVGVGANWTDVYSLAHPDITSAQLAFVTKVASVLAPFDNLYYEVINEPYINAPPVNVTPAWQDAIIAALRAADTANPHLIQQSVCNYQCAVPGYVNNGTAVISMHYSGPKAVQINYALPYIYNDGETGFSGSTDTPYRTQGWLYIMGGGGGYINLDYSFSIYRPDGTDTDNDPGGGSRALRTSLGALQRLVRSLPLRTCSPLGGSNRLAVSNVQPANAVVEAQALGCTGVVAGYLYSNATVPTTATVTVGTGMVSTAVTVTWVDPGNGSALGTPSQANTDGSGTIVLSPPPFALDVAFTLRR